MFHERMVRQVLLPTPMGKRPRGYPRTRWSDFISEPDWSPLGVEPAKISEIAVDREVFWVFLGLLPLQSSLEENCVSK